MPKTLQELKNMPLSIGLAAAVLAGAISISVATIGVLTWFDSVRDDLVEHVITELASECECDMKWPTD